MKEEFRDIKGYEGLYQVSNLGNVKSLGNGNSNNSKERILKPGNSNGYKRVVLSKNKEKKMYCVHRLVAQAFIHNPNNYPMINHKDENPLNNCVENLEWCTCKYNNNYGNRMAKIQKKNGQKIKCIDLKTQKISFYISIREAAKSFKTGFSSIYNNIHNAKYPYLKRYIFSIVQ